ncbi:MAG: oligosaccharide repeat unit polymerase [Candidatus Marinimicrobia bacterium]|nr:oligosaccharide repeat unit polymerase [Candidatus Neomarinimicrobiota bacterium]
MKSKWKLTGLIPLLLVVVDSLVNLNRFGLITSLGLWFFYAFVFQYVPSRNEQKALLKKVLLYTLIAAVLVALFFYLIMSIRAFYATDLNHFIKRSFYAYFSGSPAAFEKLLYEPGSMTYGASSFRSVVKRFSRFGLMESGAYMGAHNAFRNIGLGMPMTLNTFTFVKTMYEDFGILGVAFISAGWGMLARYAIEKSFLKFSILNLFIVSVFVLSFFMTFYEFFFQGVTMFVYWSLILLFIERYFEKRGILLHGTER